MMPLHQILELFFNVFVCELNLTILRITNDGHLSFCPIPPLFRTFKSYSEMDHSMFLHVKNLNALTRIIDNLINKLKIHRSCMLSS